MDYPRLRRLIEEDRNDLQERIDAAAGAAVVGGVAERVECTRWAVHQVAIARERRLDIVRAAAPAKAGRGPFARAWRSFDRAVGRR